MNAKEADSRNKILSLDREEEKLIESVFSYCLARNRSKFSVINTAT